MENKNVKKKVDNEKKQKAKNIAFKVLHGVSYLLSGLFIATCCFACANMNKSQNKKQNNNVVYVEEREYIEKPKNLIEYNDTSKYIYFTDDELNGAKYPSFGEYLKDLYLSGGDSSSLSDITFEYEGLNYYCSDLFSTYVDFVDREEGEKEIMFTFDTRQDYELNEWSLFYNGSIHSFTDDEDLYIYFTDDDLYEEFKTIFGLNGNIQNGIFETLTDSLVGYVDVLNQGLQDMVSIVYNSTTNKLTAIGVLITIVVAVGLGYFLFRLISSYVRLRG